MRIVGGRLKRRQVPTAELLNVRPTMDRTRETLFNLLANIDGIEGRQVLDLFAGSGALGIEALSRGAAHCHFIEKRRHNARLLSKLLQDLELEALSTVTCADALDSIVRLAKLPSASGFDLVFCDPPYAAALTNQVILTLHRSRILRPGAVFVAEHGLAEMLLPPSGWQCLQERTMASSKIEIFQLSGAE